MYEYGYDKIHTIFRTQYFVLGYFAINIHSNKKRIIFEAYLYVGQSYKYYL